jgi:Carboxypeptidase regulatory-like domain
MRQLQSRLLALQVPVLQVVLSCLFLAASSSLLAQAPPQVSTGGAGYFRIAGTILSAGEGHPLARARVSLQDVKNPKARAFVITGDDGRFEFTHIPAGKYSLEGAKRGYIPAAYDQHEQFNTAIVTGAGVDTENLSLRLVATAGLTGHVLDEFGEPVRNAAVTLWRDDHSGGVGRTIRSRTDQTDDQGLFEFAPLDASTYFVSAVASPWYAMHPRSIRQAGMPEVPTSVDSALDVVYLPTYYAGATEVEDATPILVRGGDHVDLDIHLTPVPALHVILRTPAQAQGGQLSPVPMLFKRDIDVPEQGLPAEVQMTAPGVFEITAAPGKYNLDLPRGKPGSSGINVETTVIDITQDNQEVDVSAGQPVSNISAKVEIVGETAIPPQMTFSLRSAQHRIVAFAQVTPAHEIIFASVVPGTYEVLAGADSRAYSVISMVVNGAPVSGHIFTVPVGPLALSITVIGGAADVNGVAQRAGKPAAGAMIVLLPKNPEENPQLFRRDQSDLDGTFTFHSVIRGNYTVIAIENGWDLDWSRAAVISPYIARGQRLLVGGGHNTSIELPSPIEVQTK